MACWAGSGMELLAWERMICGPRIFGKRRAGGRDLADGAAGDGPRELIQAVPFDDHFCRRFRHGRACSVMHRQFVENESTFANFARPAPIWRLSYGVIR